VQASVVGLPIPQLPTSSKPKERQNVVKTIKNVAIAIKNFEKKGPCWFSTQQTFFTPSGAFCCVAILSFLGVRAGLCVQKY